MKDYGKVMDTLAPWIQEMKFNPTSQRWVVKFHPNHLVEVYFFSAVIESLMRHVCNETIWLVCDALDIDFNKVISDDRSEIYADARQVCALVIIEAAPHISQTAVSRSLGWSSHAMIHQAKKNSHVAQIDKKIKKVYSSYPFLKDSSIPFK